MKTKHILGIGALAILTLSCNNDEVMTPSDGLSTVIATYETRGATRVTVNNSYGSLAWEKTDQIALSLSKGGFQTFTVSSITENNPAEATFSGIVVGDKLDANGVGVFPASINPTLSGTTLNVALPATYSYAKDQLNAPMLAKADGTTYPFKHLGGVAWFQVYYVPAGASHFVFKAQKKITGEFTVDLNKTTDPQIELAEGSEVVDTNNTVTIDITPNESITEQQDFYIPLPVGNYEQFTISFTDADGNQVGKCTYTTKAGDIYQLKRKDLAKFSISFVNVTGSLEDFTTNPDDE